MQDFAALKVQLVNVNKLSQQAMNEHGLAGIMTEAMRRIPSKDTERNYISVFSRLGHIAESTKIPDGFTKSTVKYMINVKSVENFESLIETSNQVPSKMKGEIMTTADYLRKEGEEHGALKNSIKIAINMLKEGLDKAFVSKTTELDMEKVEELSKQLDA